MNIQFSSLEVHKSCSMNMSFAILEEIAAFLKPSVGNAEQAANFARFGQVNRDTCKIYNHHTPEDRLRYLRYNFNLNVHECSACSCVTEDVLQCHGCHATFCGDHPHFSYCNSCNQRLCYACSNINSCEQCGINICDRCAGQSSIDLCGQCAEIEDYY